MFVTKAQYLSLCKACDDILLEESSVERVSVTWLHIIREHPIFLNNYVQLFDKGLTAIDHVILRARKLVVHLAKISYHLIRSIFLTPTHLHLSQSVPQKLDFLFISHCINVSDAGNDKDFYFDNVINELQSRGYNVIVGLVNHTGKDEKVLSSVWSDAKVPRFIFSRSLGLLSELLLVIQLFRQFARLFQRSSRYRSNEFLFQLNRYAAIETFAGNSLSTLRRHKQVEWFVERYKPACLVTTYEGHAWERVAFFAAKSAYPKIVCKSYQHAALFRLQHAICRNLPGNFNPDVILVAGGNSFNRMRNESALEGIPVQVLGTNRGSMGSVPEVVPAIVGPANTMVKILVVPEGIYEEVVLLFEYSLKQATENSEISYVWRLHPLTDKEALIKKNEKFRTLPPNIRWSENGEQIANNLYTHVLYRGTTMIIQAALAGLQPIYLDRLDEMTIDLLYETSDFKITVFEQDNLKNCIQTYLQNNTANILPAYLKLKEYCLNYYTPFNPSILEEKRL